MIDNNFGSICSNKWDIDNGSTNHDVLVEIVSHLPGDMAQYSFSGDISKEKLSLSLKNPLRDTILNPVMDINGTSQILNGDPHPLNPMIYKKYKSMEKNYSVGKKTLKNEIKQKYFMEEDYNPKKKTINDTSNEIEENKNIDILEHLHLCLEHPIFFQSSANNIWPATYDVFEMDNLKDVIKVNNNRFITKKKRNLIIVDWDDTIFPTSWILKKNINVITKNYLNDKNIMKIINRLDTILCKLLEKMISVGKVIIITNATLSWIKHCCTILLKSNEIIIKNVEIISANDNYSKKYPLKISMWKKKEFNNQVFKYLKNNGYLLSYNMVTLEENKAITNPQKLFSGCFKGNIPASKDVSLKKCVVGYNRASPIVSHNGVLSENFVSGKARNKQKNEFGLYKHSIISIGDSNYEYNALINLYENINEIVNLKTIKFKQNVSIENFMEQLKILRENIGIICETDNHVDLLFENKTI